MFIKPMGGAAIPTLQNFKAQKLRFTSMHCTKFKFRVLISELVKALYGVLFNGILFFLYTYKTSLLIMQRDPFTKFNKDILSHRQSYRFPLFSSSRSFSDQIYMTPYLPGFGLSVTNNH